MKKILVATDFSEYGRYAVKSATSLARKTGAQLILLHVVNSLPNSDHDSYENYYDMPGDNTIICNIQNKLDAIVSESKLKGSKVIYELRCDVSKTILYHANGYKVDLIVMGTFGSKGSGKLIIGSNTESVMLHAKMPVLIVRE